MTSIREEQYQGYWYCSVLYSIVCLYDNGLQSRKDIFK
jgi:hypothetical protein